MLTFFAIQVYFRQLDGIKTVWGKKMSNWFTEELGISSGHRQQIEITERLHDSRSPFQHIEVVQTKPYGRMLILDNTVMCTEFDEYSYHEMISHPALFTHPAPKRVLVVGGGDGGTVREVLRHPSVKEVHLCELDEGVVEACKKYLPGMSGKLDDPRVTIYYEDGVKWVADHPDAYDVILVDSTDPVGPAEALFGFEFFESCKKSLREEGILVNQAENFILHEAIVKRLIAHGKKLFPVHRYYFTLVPTYPGGMIGFTFFSKRHDPIAKGVLDGLESRSAGMQPELSYWNPDTHRSAFTLPSKSKAALFS